MDSSEKIKILLEDFREKEELNKAEISEIEKQIAELEELIISSKERMARVQADKEKVFKMKNRYAGGDWSDVLEKASEKIKEQAEANLKENKDNGVREDTEPESQQEEITAPAPEPETAEPVASDPASEQPDYSESVQAEAVQDPAKVGVATSEVVPIPQVQAQENQPQPEVQNPPEVAAQAGNIPSGQDVSPVALDNPDAPPILPGIPNPPTGFDAMQTPPGLPNQLQNQPVPSPQEEQSESLFPFSQGAGQEIDQDAPWTGIAWENSETPEAPQPAQQQAQPQAQQQAQPPQMQQPQPVQQQPPQQPPVPHQLQQPQPQPQPPQAPPAQPQMQTQDGQEIAPPKMPPSPPPLNQNVADPNVPAAGGPPSVEFDISDALNPDQEPAKKKDEEKGKKINDALKGLFK